MIGQQDLPWKDTIEAAPRREKADNGDGVCQQTPDAVVSRVEEATVSVPLAGAGSSGSWEAGFFS